jgi:hypothetical protein
MAALAAYYGYRAKQQSKQANDAVNHTGPDDLRLYDLVASTHRRVATLETRQQVVTDIILTRPCMLTNLACPAAELDDCSAELDDCSDELDTDPAFDLTRPTSQEEVR